MRLVSLEIKGFKSFAKETHIHFGDDVIGIVGPNGSGKSNIVDAIRWVLGELKSKELRLNTMSDVIFNGTKTKRSAQSAKVTLNFENSKNLLPTEFNNIAITRVLFKDGNSEYRINDVKCRLKDITNLFMDSGIGSNSYAIIALGMVEDILSDKDNARRNMFEQAAGISKYKERKKQTISKLASTEEDLNRLDDLLFEIESNLKELGKQARRTKRYQQLKEDYKSNYLTLAKHQWVNFSKKREEIDSKLEKQDSEVREIETKVLKIEADIELKKKLILDKEQLLSSTQKEVNAIQDQIRLTASAMDTKEQRIQFLKENLGKLEGQKERSDEKLRDLMSQKNAIDAKYLEAKSTEQNSVRKFEDLKVVREKLKGELAKKQDSIQTFHTQLNALQKQIVDLEKEYAVTESSLKAHQTALFDLDDELGKNKVAFSTSKKRLAELEKEIEKQNLQLSQNESEIKELLERKEQLEEAIKKKENELNTYSVNHLSLRKERDLLVSLIEQMEGFPESVKFLSKNKNWNKDYPILSDVLEVEDHYRLALESFLGAFLNYFIVDNWESAHKAVELLHDGQKGRAGFFVLSEFHAKEEESSEILNIVKTEKRYESLVSHLLKGVAFSDEKNNLEVNDWTTVISSDGQWIRETGRLVGGSIGLFDGAKIGRKSKLKKIEKEIVKLHDVEVVMRKELQALKDQWKTISFDQLHRQKKELETQLTRLKQEQLQLQAFFDNASRVNENIETKKSKLDVDISEGQRKMKEIEHKVAALQESLKTLQSEHQEAKGTIENETIAYQTVNDEYNQANIAMIQSKNYLQNVENEFNFNKKQIAEVEGFQRSYEGQKAQNITEQKAILREIESLKENHSRKVREREQKSLHLTEQEKTFFQERGQIDELDTQLRALNKNRNTSNQISQQLKEARNELKLELNRVEDRVKVEFEMEMDEVVEAVSDLIEAGQLEGLQKAIADQKEKLTNFGPINLMAVEAFDEMQERYDTLMAQKSDVQEAKESLLSTIQEIETTATDLFLDAFYNVKEHFQKVFRSLFSEEDDCDLVLEEEENPLESKIEIIAKPKGKRPKALSQLSGGEKTLTAISLLFALYLIKPAPFCIFDEVDAPLDDANIDKFNNIIRKFSKESQFIIITHNKLTMAEVDVIYGVYMDEPGISQVTAVDFSHL